jgi:predicted Rossmann fold flavoprotein
MKRVQADIAVLGGGPAGLAAAVSAGRAFNGRGRVVLLERGKRVGKKLLSTGNGRCNLSNRELTPCHYHGAGRAVLERFLQNYPTEAVVQFFRSIGIFCRDEEGRIYPYSGQAATVLDALRRALQELSVEELCESCVTALQNQGGRFLLSGPETSIAARRVIVATGGMAAPSTGSDGSGYPLLQRMGHSMRPIFPALSPIRSPEPLLRSLKGVRCAGAVSLVEGNRILRREQGEIQFLENALSGICVFQLARQAAKRCVLKGAAGGLSPALYLRLDLAPELTHQELFGRLEEVRRDHPDVPLEEFLSCLFQKRLGFALVKTALPGPYQRPCASLSRDELQRLAAVAKGWELPVDGTLGWDRAQVTAGGVPLAEFDPDTLESRIIPGLYAAGEVLDVDGDCGGYNLHWAFCSGMLSGESAARSLMNAKKQRKER